MRDNSSKSTAPGKDGGTPDLAIFQTKDAECAQLIGALQSGGRAVAPSSTEEALSYLGSHKDGRLIVFYARPDECLAAALDRGEKLAEGLERCRTHIRTVLELVRTDRKRVVLAESGAARAQPAALAAALQARLGVSFPALKALTPSEQTEATEPHRALAVFTLLECADLRRQCAELEASALPMASERSQQLHAEALFDHLTALRDEALRAQDAEQVADENRRLLEQLIAAQGAIEAAALKEADAVKHIAELTAQEANIRQTLAAVHASTSWRVTAPIRALRELFLRPAAGKQP